MATDASTAQAEAPTTELLTGVVGDRCAHCQTSLASDQRYCVSCGERRGTARFVAADLATPETPRVSAGPPPEPESRPRAGAGATLVAGVATLLIAMGVGVLIGHNSTSTPTRASAPVQVVTLGGGATGATPSTTAQARHAKPGRAHRIKPTIVNITPKVAAAASRAASHVFGSAGNLSSNVTQQQGSACSGGAGCENHRFTGNFFH